MSKIAIPSAWKAVTTATPSPKVSRAQAITSWGSRSSSSTLSSPISRSSKVSRRGIPAPPYIYPPESAGRIVSS
jgi:hypothetical protein